MTNRGKRSKKAMVINNNELIVPKYKMKESFKNIIVTYEM